MSHDPFSVGWARPISKDANTHGRTPTTMTIVEPDSVLEDNGRTYHGYKQGSYFLPNDGVEQDRLDFLHKAMRIALDDRLYLAPLPHEPAQVLDVACGTGIWALQYAAEHPRSQVLGTDLSRIQPDTADPPNCAFIKDDAEAEWVFPRRFDFVHLRQVVTCFDDPRKVMRQAFLNLNADGWIEYQDFGLDLVSHDGSVHGTSIARWFELMIDGAANLGRGINVAKHYATWLVQMGFVDVVQIQIPIPMNDWPKDAKWRRVGKYIREDILMGIDGISRKMLLGAGLSVPQIQSLLGQVKQDLRNPNIRCCLPLHVVFGRKPHLWEMSNMGTKHSPQTPYSTLVYDVWVPGATAGYGAHVSVF